MKKKRQEYQKKMLCVEITWILAWKDKLISEMIRNICHWLDWIVDVTRYGYTFMVCNVMDIFFEIILILGLHIELIK